MKAESKWNDRKKTLHNREGKTQLETATTMKKLLKTAVQTTILHWFIVAPFALFHAKLSAQWMSTINVCHPNFQSSSEWFPKPNWKEALPLVVALEVTAPSFASLSLPLSVHWSLHTLLHLPYHTAVSFTAVRQAVHTVSFVCVQWNVYANFSRGNGSTSSSSSSLDWQMNECSNATDSADVSTAALCTLGFLIQLLLYVTLLYDDTAADREEGAHWSGSNS